MWETVESGVEIGLFSGCSRLEVPGGWIVRSVVKTATGTGVGVVQTFVSDPVHLWKLKSEPMQPTKGYTL